MFQLAFLTWVSFNLLLYNLHLLWSTTNLSLTLRGLFISKFPHTTGLNVTLLKKITVAGVR